MTPRQATACLDVAEQRKDAEEARAININLLGARGDEKSLRERFKLLTGE